ncbi:MAG TPA: IPT/TIG domain-containing protein [Polyangia bacterium]|jgi:hypothetical protein
MRTAVLSTVAPYLLFGLLFGCSHTKEGPTPVVSSVEPKLLCNAQAAVDLTVDGSGFSPLPSNILGTAVLLVPEVSLAGEGGPFTLPTDDGYLITPLTQITARIPAATLPTPASGTSNQYDLTVTNPNARRGSLAAAITNLPPPTISSVTVPREADSGVRPTEICVEQGDRTITIHGTDFHDQDGTGVPAQPAVDLIDAAGATHAIPADRVTYVDAQTLTVVIAQGSLTPGTYTVVVTNPEAGSCMAQLENGLQVVPPPTITGVDALCADTASALTIHGTGFLPGATVTVGGTTYTDVTVADDGTTITVPAFTLPLGAYDVTVTNKDGCGVTATGALEVVPAPSVFGVDPNVVYSGVATPVTIYGKDFAAGVTVLILDGSGAQVGDPLTPSSIAADGRTLEVTIPQGLTAGTYSITVKLGGCGTALTNALTVVDTATVRVCSVAPPFGWTGEDTAVTIHGGTCTGTAGFVATPRAWIVLPDTLVPLNNVSFVSAAEIHAVVPAGIAAGSYPLLVQNPSGAIGFLADAFTVVANPVPVVTNVAPANAVSGVAQPVTISGTNFRAAGGGPAVTLVSQAGASVALTNVAVVSPTQVTAIVPATVLTGTYLVHLVNLDENTFGPDWASFIVTGPSAKLTGFVNTGKPLPQAREGHAMLGGSVTNQARFLYVIGGDTAPTTPLDTVVANPLDAFGDLSDWQVLRSRLPAARTGLGGAQAGHFLYVAGGRDGSGVASAEVLRAEVLLPADAPANIRPTLDFVTTGAGLAAGTWYYRVAAVMRPDDPTNPAGEGLPSDEVVMRAPAVGTLKWVITLTWDAVPRADHYRIYRTPAADGTSGEEVLLADNLAATTFSDNGTATPGAATPMPQGSTGVWTVAGTLQTARADAGAAVAHDAAGNAYFYVVGGQTGWPNTGVLDTYEVAPMAADGSGFSAAFARDDTHKLVRATTRAALMAAENANASVIPATVGSFLYLAGGYSTGPLSDVELAQVGTGGILSWADTANPGGRIDATAGIVQFNHVYMFGGLSQAGTVQLSTTLGELQDATGVPKNFSSTSVPMTTPHALHAASFFAGHAYISGGFTAGSLTTPTLTSVVEWAQFTQ